MARPAGLAVASLHLALTLSALSATAQGPLLDGCPAFPSDNVWNVRVDTLPVHPLSATWVATIGTGDNLHPDFGSGTYAGSPIGIPWVSVPGTQPKKTVSFVWPDESDTDPYPIPDNPPIEGGSDRHILIVDRDNCFLYELFNAQDTGGGNWSASSGAIFDLFSHALRPDGWTSADAAGLPILPGLARQEEVAAGEIRHALRFTAPQTRDAHVWPARHDASGLTQQQYPPLGIRVRLKQSFDTTGTTTT